MIAFLTLTSPPEPIPRRREIVFRGLAVILVAAFVWASAEALLRGAPDLLPSWYRLTLPSGGIELFYPGILARTPIEAVPIPYRFSRRRDFHTPPPHDLETMGLLTPEVNADRERYRSFYSRVDAQGFFNARDMDRADVLLVGDSFARIAGMLSPPGLQVRLEERIGRSIFNLGIPALGPRHQAWLVEEIGLAKTPEAVVWLFFAGNDLVDAATYDDLREQGFETHADRFPDSDMPRSWVIDLLSKALRKPKRRPSVYPPTEGFVFESRQGKTSIWFNPPYLRRMARPIEELENHRGWAPTKEILRKTATRLEERGIRFLVVYVPSKPQVYLALVERNEALAFQTAFLGRDLPPHSSPERFFARALANSDHLERMLKTFCDASGIPFLSLTARLRDLGRGGELGYLAADSHWNEIGQGVAVEPLARWVDGMRP